MSYYVSSHGTIKKIHSFIQDAVYFLQNTFTAGAPHLALKALSHDQAESARTRANPPASYSRRLMP